MLRTMPSATGSITCTNTTGIDRASPVKLRRRLGRRMATIRSGRVFTQFLGQDLCFTALRGSPPIVDLDIATVSPT